LRIESWDDIFEGSDNFLDIKLKIFNVCFPKSKHNSAHRYNPWISRGIKLSRQNKRILYMRGKGSNDTNLKLQKKRYCKILTEIIKTAKKKYFGELIFKSKNKNKYCLLKYRSY